MKPADVRKLENVEIEQKLREASDEMFNLRVLSETDKVEKTHRMRELRRDAARFRTVLRERTLVPAGTAAAAGTGGSAQAEAAKGRGAGK